LGLKLRIRRPSNDEELSEFPIAAALTPFADIAHHTQAGSFHLIPEFTVPSETGQDLVRAGENLHCEVVDTK
jgi:hypothetical protein